MGSDLRSLREWHVKYMAHDNDNLTKDSEPIKALESDDLDIESFEPWIHAAMQDTQVNEGFCSPCHYLLDNWPTFKESFTWEDGKRVYNRPEPVIGRYCNTTEIEASTRMSCKFCANLLQRLKDTELLTIFRKIEWRLNQLGEESACALSIFPLSTNKYHINLYLPDIPSASYQSLHVTLKCSDTTWLADLFGPNDLKWDIFTQINKWLLICCNTHESCNTTAQPHLPTRLVSLLDGKPRVILTAEIPLYKFPLRYATLSYCWGKRPFLQLRLKNIEVLTTSIPTEGLPQTFADAFEIASQLEIDYIWIDSLCIIQDDEDDWQKEAELMYLVYSGSYINIAASTAKDVYQGCLLEQPSFSDGFSAEITKGGIQKVLEIRDRDVYDRAITKSHLMTRAWAIQEKILSPRTLHFGSRGVFWDCKEGFASEYFRTLAPYGASLAEAAGCIRSIYFWQIVVATYSNANLTYRSDKLWALAGMARAAFDITEDDYLSGIWRANIEHDLCWRVVGPRRTRKRVDRQDPDWIAPSWSWASIDGPVGFQSWAQGDERYGHVFETSPIFPKGEDFGKASCIVLHLRCSALVAGRFCDEPALPAESSWTTDSVSIESDGGDFILPIEVDCIDDSSGRRNEVIYLLPLSNSDDLHWNWSSRRQLMGIVLLKTAGAAGEYCRIGYFDIPESEDYWSSPRQIFRKILRDVGAATAEAGRAEAVSNPEYPSEKYVITIV